MKKVSVAALFSALAVLMTWPLARNIGTAVAYPGDPYLNVWILDWDWWATFHQPLSLFHANAFAPARDALAFSENLYGIALLLFPLRAIGVSPIAAHNVAMLAGFAFSGFAAYLLGELLTGSLAGGLAAGIFYAFVPFRFTHLPHVQHVWGGWLPMLLVALLLYERRPDWRQATLFGTVFLMNGLSNIHWLVFGAVAIVCSAPFVVRRWFPIVTTTAIASLLLLPFLYPYVEAARLYGMVRSWSETMHFSAQWHDWLVASAFNHLYAGLHDARVDPELWLFPGVLSILLALAGAFVARRDRRHLTIALVWIVLGVLGSLGLHAFFHRFLFEYAPGFRAIRVPARWAAVAYVGMAMLVAYGTAWIEARRRWVALVAPLAFLFELNAAPIRWYQAPADEPDVYRWIAENGGRGSLLELPMNEVGSEYGYMLRATIHHRPIVNGISGFVPRETREIDRMVHQSPISDDFLPRLQADGCAFIIAHGDWISDEVRKWLWRECLRGRMGFVKRFNSVRGRNDWIFSIGAPGPFPGELQGFFRGYLSPSDDVVARLDLPAENSSVRGAVHFTGIAMSARGIRRVTLLLQNGGVRIPATLSPEEKWKQIYPWAVKTTRPRFDAELPSRPPGVRLETDVQVEIIDGEGRTTLLDDRWFEWR